MREIPYDRYAAVYYARRWAFGRNPAFYDFENIGGDCTNIASQCIYAGCRVMNYTPTYGWYYISPENRAPDFTSVEYFYDFMTGAPEFARENGGTGPFGFPIPLSRVQPGDVVQLSDEAGDFYHTLIVSAVENGEIYVCAHSDDALDRRISTYSFNSLRFIHIEGVRMEILEDDCFRALNEGIALP